MDPYQRSVSTCVAKNQVPAETPFFLPCICSTARSPFCALPPLSPSEGQVVLPYLVRETSNQVHENKPKTSDSGQIRTFPVILYIVFTQRLI